MADISLTASMRSNLLSLQQTQSLMDQTQERLSTGKKVNSAIDNPSSYYTAQSLSNRASDLSSLLDSMGQGVQTIQAANEAIEAITTFAQQAKSIANSARDVANNMRTKVSTTKEPSGKTAADSANVYVDSRKDMSKAEITTTGTSQAEKELTLVVDGKEHLIKFTEGDAEKATAMAIKGAIEAAGISGISVSTNEGKVTIEGEGKAISVIAGTSGVTGDVATAIDVKDSDAQAIVAKFNANANVTASLDENGKLVVKAKEGGAAEAAGQQIHVFGDAKAKEVLGSSFGGVIDTKVTDEKAIAERNKYVEQFNEVLSQIDSLAKDAGYKGINLLQENDLKVIFNEDRSSSIEIKGVDASSKGLGLESVAKGDWNLDSAVDDAITQIEDAITELRSMASDFGNNYSIVQTREDFTENLINVLEEGADKLTLADMNEEGANMLALQTRQQLAVNSLSLASQASQAVLQLF